MLSKLPSSRTETVALAGLHSSSKSTCSHCGPLRRSVSRQIAFGTQRQHRRCQRDRQSLQTVCAVKRKSEKNLVCSKTLTVKPDHKAQAEKLCHQIVDFSKQRMKDSKNGMLAFECSQDIYEPNVLHFWERYDGNRSMGLHNTTDEYSKFMTTIQQHLEGPIGMALYEWQDGKIGMACVHGGPKGEGGLDDATGAGGAGGASMKQSSAVVDLGDVKRNDGKEAWGMGLNFRFPWQKKKDKEDAKKKEKK